MDKETRKTINAEVWIVKKFDAGTSWHVINTHQPEDVKGSGATTPEVIVKFENRNDAINFLEREFKKFSGRI